MDKIILNVGGRRFETTRSTILKFPDATLAKIIGPNGKPDPDGSYFIDRNPKIFNLILDYYRSNYLAIPPGIDINLLERETQFWGIDYTRERTLKTPTELFDLSSYLIHFLGNLRTGCIQHHIISEIYSLIQFGHRRGYDHIAILLGDIKINKKNLDRLAILEKFFSFSKIETIFVRFNSHGIATIRDVIWQFNAIDLDDPSMGQVGICYF